MTVHLIKLSVGVENVRHLEQIQQHRLNDAERRGETPELMHVTRNTPRRAAEILENGSIYWVIKRFIRARQVIADIRPVDNKEGRPACALVLEPGLIRTEIRSFRAFQGWRYLPVEDAPADAPENQADGTEVPAEMAAELKGLGLL
ncbi:MAG: DUF1489 domain-containing protein [Alphaproteobacteria bacterium]|jgi:hypothetical protein|nr:DUF1489 domain-containing protein [Alphaproteobacteria bacterium]